MMRKLVRSCCGLPEQDHLKICHFCGDAMAEPDPDGTLQVGEPICADCAKKLS